MEPQIVKVDRQYRNRLLVAYLIAILAGYLLIKFAWPVAVHAFRQLNISSSFTVAEIVFAVFFLCFIGPALYLISIGKKIIKSGMHPFPGQKVLRDTIIVTGSKAMFRGKVLVRLGYTSIVMAILGCVWLHLVFMWIKHDPLMRMMPLL
jgi:hypothetical protein